MAGPRPGEIERVTAALESMVWQFAYRSDHGTLYTGGLSALEDAFEVLDWEDPHEVDPSNLCDEPGCRRFPTCGTLTPGGYRSTCSVHQPTVEEVSGRHA